ncbi:MAG: 23S rRNA (uracil(1939)-C(5))-methyltransferase RlmD, partial [Cyclobacteriaceae bacterium]|nr:23S rRNA (uracil(1939)-C(5))-methyltransferase RlmD [Cyclobacteriaceae bacterium]
MKENPIIKIESMSSTGSAIGHMDKLVVFVEKAVPGDLVKLRIKKKKKNYLEATMVDLLEPSPARVTPTCSHVGLCGGCKWQHIDYHEQLRYKQQQVTDNLVKLAKVPIGIIHDIVPSVKQYYYRNKLEFTFSNKRWLYKEEISSGEAIERSGLGFHLPGQFDKVLDVEKCHLQADPSNQIRTLVRKHALEMGMSFYNINTHEGFLRNLIVRTTMTGEVMVILQVGYEDSREIATILDILKENITPLTSLNYVVNSKKNDTFHDLTVHTWYGKSFISETFQRPDNKGVLHFKISPKSFFQTNSIQAEILYKIAWEFSSLTGNEIVYDLYTGTGTIANYVAGSAKKVIGIEYVPEAIADAKENSILNII